MSEQLAAIEAAHVKFVGMSLDALEEPPAIDDIQEFTVTAVCIGESQERRKDGEMRRTMKMEVQSVRPGQISKPERDPELPFKSSEDDEL